MSSLTKTILRNIARENVRRVGLTKINKKHTFTHERKDVKRSKAFLFTTQSIFSRNWRKFCPVLTPKMCALKQLMRKERKLLNLKGGDAMKKFI